MGPTKQPFYRLGLYHIILCTGFCAFAESLGLHKRSDILSQYTYKPWNEMDKETKHYG